MELKEIVMRLVGPIRPIAETNTDARRLENLKVLCDLVNELVFEIDSVAYENKERQEHSVRAISGYAADFLKDTLGIVE